MDNSLRDTTDIVVDSANEFWNTIAEFLPQVIGALVLVVVGALVAKLAADFTRWAFNTLGVDKLKNNKWVKQTLSKTDLKFNVVEASARIVFWLVILVVAMSAASVLELDAMSNALRDLLAYVPNVLAAVIVLALTVAGARLTKSFVAGSLRQLSADYAQGLGTAAQAFVVVFGVVLAAAQLGFDTTLLVTNLSVIVAGVVLAGALAFGLGGKNLAANVLASTYTSSALREGDEITVAGVKGKVQKVGRVAVVVETKDGDVVVPNNQIVS